MSTYETIAKVTKAFVKATWQSMEITGASAAGVPMCEVVPETRACQPAKPAKHEKHDK